MLEKATEIIARHEGLRLKPYTDSVGKLSIGYGRNLDDVGISEAEAKEMLKSDVMSAYRDAKKFDWFYELNGPRRAAIINMVFNLGLPRFKRFSKTLDYMADADYAAAAAEILEGTGPDGKSRWFHQVGVRALEVSAMLKSGVWPE
jgi:lysozyme